MYTHNIEEVIAGKRFRAVLTYDSGKRFKSAFDLGVYDTEAEALAAVEQAKLLHAEDLKDPKDMPQNRLERYIDTHYRKYYG
ncbi:hypothetical protein [Cytobacillus praedii]|uniref:hypothetical protein n=1 Tax=Cytobacillus praedii TaxID=1742358 RepID=UPI00070A8A4E|nr:hypothetical protein [Cytobacillus praedii]